MSGFVSVLSASANANANVTILVILGIAATFKGVFDQQGISDLGKLVYHISLPSLLLVNILREISLGRVQALCILPIFCFMHISFAYGATRLLNCLFRISEVEARPVLATVMFGNVGALAIAVLVALCNEHPFDDFFGGQAECKSKSTSFIAFYLVSQNIMMFTWGERILLSVAREEKKRMPTMTPDEPFLRQRSFGDNQKERIMLAVPSVTAMDFHAEQAEEEEEDNLGPLKPLSRLNSPGGSKVSLVSQIDEREVELRLTAAAIREVSSRLPLEVKAWHPMHHGGVDALLNAFEDEEDEFPSPQNRRVSSKLAGMMNEKRGAFLKWWDSLYGKVLSTVRRWSFRRCYRGTRRRLINANRAIVAMLANPPLQAAIIGICLGLIPQTKALLVGEEAPLRSIFSAVETLGSSQVPVSMLMLSGSGTLRYLQRAQKHLEKSLGESEIYTDREFSFSHGAVFIMIFGRLIIIPIFGFASWWIFKSLNLLPSDPLIGFVMLIESAVPSAQNVVMLLLVHGELAQGQAMAEVILWQYAAAIPIFTVVCGLFAQLIIV